MDFETTKQTGVMDKSRKKYDSVNAAIIKVLAARFGVTDTYVRLILRDRNMQSDKAEQIRREFKRLYDAVSATIHRVKI